MTRSLGRTRSTGRSTSTACWSGSWPSPRRWPREGLAAWLSLDADARRAGRGLVVGTDEAPPDDALPARAAVQAPHGPLDRDAAARHARLARAAVPAQARDRRRD